MTSEGRGCCGGQGLVSEGWAWLGCATPQISLRCTAATAAGLSPWRRWRQRHQTLRRGSPRKQTAPRQLLSLSSLFAAGPLPPTACRWACDLGWSPAGLANTACGSPHDVSVTRLHGLETLAHLKALTSQFCIGAGAALAPRMPPLLHTVHGGRPPVQCNERNGAGMATTQSEALAVLLCDAPPPDRDKLIKTVDTQLPGSRLLVLQASPGAGATSFFGPVGTSLCYCFCFSQPDRIAMMRSSPSETRQSGYRCSLGGAKAGRVRAGCAGPVGSPLLIGELVSCDSHLAQCSNLAPPGAKQAGVLHPPPPHPLPHRESSGQSVM